MNYKNNIILLLAVLLPITTAQSVTVDSLLVKGSKQDQIFFNTDQKMQDGDVNKTNLQAVQGAFKNSKTTDSIKDCEYKEDHICKIIIRERMPTIIQLPEYEWVYDWLLGDEVNFELDVLKNTTNSVSLKSYYPGVDTSLNIFGGSGLIYSFYILSNSVNAEKVSDFVVRVKTDQKTTEKIMQAKRFYKERPAQNELIDEVVKVNIKNGSLHSVFKKILPSDWNLNIDKKLEKRNRLVDVISEDKTRQQIIVDLARDLQLKPIFYPKLRLLVITSINTIIQ